MLLNSSKNILALSSLDCWHCKSGPALLSQKDLQPDKFYILPWGRIHPNSVACCALEQNKKVVLSVDLVQIYQHEPFELRPHSRHGSNRAWDPMWVQGIFGLWAHLGPGPIGPIEPKSQSWKTFRWWPTLLKCENANTKFACPYAARCTTYVYTCTYYM